MPQTPAATPKQIERRRSPRRRVLLGGKIVLPAGTILDCTIHDLSEGGARVKTSPDHHPPDEFILIDLKVGIAYLVAVRWRETPWVGVSFAVRLDLRGAVPPGLAHLRRLWLDGLARSSAAVSADGDASPERPQEVSPYSREGW